MIPIKIDSAWQGTSDCRNCGIRDMVLFADLNEQDFAQIHTPIDDLVFPPAAVLYTEGEQALGIFTSAVGRQCVAAGNLLASERTIEAMVPAF